VRILITNAGGSLGQGVLRLLRKWYPEAYLTAVSFIFPSAAGLYADRVIKAEPYNYNDEDVIFMKKICKDEKIDLIIPCSDYDTYLLQKFAGDLPLIACSNEKMSLCFYDKYLTAQLFKEHGLPFALSWLPSKYDKIGQSVIVKPRCGGLSQAIYREPKELSVFGDDFVVQQLKMGKEITIGLYVTRDQRLHGFIVLERELWNGITVQSQVTREYDELIGNFCQLMIEKLPIKSSLNIQAIVTEDGQLVPFEINGRVSGTCTIRDNFGFTDVKYLVEEYLLNKAPSKPSIKPGYAVRVLRDVIVPGGVLNDIHNLQKMDFFEF